ncbi:MAG TPA: 4'-phosphopantetheinyl transferase superfamily protein [Candidatus Binatia bacterium]|nr:4'-phosphopantetheinyl transferase superfamily protein [Candidatus Binatia bacterium]
MTSRLPDGAVHVWWVRPERVVGARIAACAALLAPDERARVARMRAGEARHAALVTRALVRTVLSCYADVDPRAWVFGAGRHGRPRIAGPPGAPRLSFNVSHTRGLVACAVGRRAVGVDVERRARRAPALALAGRWFAPAEAHTLRALPSARRRARFLALWTLKEAYAKVRGLGLTLGLRRVRFGIDRTGRVRAAFAPGAGRPGRWSFALVRPTSGHLMAVAARRAAGRRTAIVVRELRTLGECVPARRPERPVDG